MPVSATTRLESQKAQSKDQRITQRPDSRGYPTTGVPWGQPGWVPDVPNELDLTYEVFGGVTVAPFANLAALKADGTYGDGNLVYNSGGDFTTGQYVTLQDASVAHYNTAAWSVGASA